MTKEYILCSAIWYDDKKVYAHQPKNIKSGFVICGRRHHNCIMTVAVLAKMNMRNCLKFRQMKQVQGFLTNKDKLVNRRKGYDVAFISGQIKEAKGSKLLFSEDLW
jgi:hypothetical protein